MSMSQNVAVRLLALLIVASFACKASFAQEAKKSGFKSTINRFLGVGSKPAEDQPAASVSARPSEDMIDVPAVPQVELPNDEETSDTTSEPEPPRSKALIKARPTGGLFKGGLFHPLRSINNNLKGNAEATDDDIPDASENETEQAAAREPVAVNPPQNKLVAPKPPSIEPFSKLAVPPSAVAGMQRVPPSSQGRATDLPPTQVMIPSTIGNARANTASLPQIVSGNSARGQSLPATNPTSLRSANINNQLEPLNAQSSSRRSQASASPSVVSPLKQIERTEPIEFDKPTDMAIEQSTINLNTSIAREEEFPSVSRRPVATQSPTSTSNELEAGSIPQVSRRAPTTSNAALDVRTPTNNTSSTEATRPEFVITGGPKAQASPSTSTAQLLPDPISLPQNNMAMRPNRTVANPTTFQSPLKDLASGTATAASPNANTKPTQMVVPNTTAPAMPQSLYSQTKPSPSATTSTSSQSKSTANTFVQSPAPSATAMTPTANVAQGNTLMQMEIPKLQLWVEGPDKLRVDRPVTYKVLAKNEGQQGVVGLLVSALVPAGMSAKDTKVSTGTIEAEDLEDNTQSLLWELPELAPGQVHELTFDLLASKPENFGLDIEWTVMPQSDVAKVASIQPQLLIGLEGPTDVLYGKPEQYHLKVRNPGNAPVDDVILALSADSFGTKESSIGRLAAGEEREINVELTFQQAGQQAVRADAISKATDLTSVSDIKINVSQVRLETACQIPDRQYQGSFADYVFTVENVGEVPAADAVCEIALPPGTVVAELPAGVRYVNNALMWELESMQPHSENSMQLNLQLNALGEQPLELVVKNAHGDNSTCKATVQVETISDLQLTVIDPTAPAPVSENVTYQLVIHNRGARPAREVSVIAQFSDGIEPISSNSEGADLMPGQVMFEPLQEIGPGEKVTLTISAVASKSGMHRFRAEVQCDNGETLLVQEESTRFLTTAVRNDSTSVKR
jgi:hypothetical protein